MVGDRLWQGASGGAVAAVAAGYGRDLDSSLFQVERAIHAARERGARLVVFPECALGGYLDDPPFGEGAVPPPALAPDGPEIARLARLAGPTVVCVGYTEAAAEGLYSSAVCVTGDGVLGHHRKVHVPPGELAAYRPGDRFEAFDAPVGRLGMMLCYDKVFPEAARTLALAGAEVVASMSAWPISRVRPARSLAADRQTHHFNVLDEARAVENQMVWVSANQTGNRGALRFLGHAKVVDPYGAVLATTGSRPGMALAPLEPRAAVASARDRLSHLGDRRAAAYDLAPPEPATAPSIAPPGPALAPAFAPPEPVEASSITPPEPAGAVPLATALEA